MDLMENGLIGGTGNRKKKIYIQGETIKKYLNLNGFLMTWFTTNTMALFDSYSQPHLMGKDFSRCLQVCDVSMKYE